MKTLILNAGGRRPAVRLLLSRFWGAVGGYAPSRKVDWHLVRRLVFVCSGNICRSPYGAEFARSLGCEVASFGIRTQTGLRANPSAIQVALSNGVDLNIHVTTAVEDFCFQGGDLLLAMEPEQLPVLRTYAPDGVQVTLLGLWCTKVTPYLPDPYGTPREVFQFIFSLIDDAVKNVASRLQCR